MADTKRIGKYEIIEKIGRGGFAFVYKAHDSMLDRLVALKVLHPYWTADPGFSERFRREARAAARLRHPNIVTVHETGEVEGQLYIAMEYLPGCSLQTLLKDKGILALEQALAILDQLTEALDYAHAHGVVHRDVKPGNVMIEETARGVRASLTDFGLVKAMEGNTALTSQGTLLGSPEYMAPEQADPERAGQVGPAADRYALGIVAYQMLTGRVPFPGNGHATLNAHEHKPVPSPRSLCPGLPEWVEVALLTMLAKAPEERFDSAGCFVDQLRAAWQAETEAHQREQILDSLYQQMQKAVGREAWSEVLDLTVRIQAVDPGYRDAIQWQEQALQKVTETRFRLSKSMNKDQVQFSPTKPEDRKSWKDGCAKRLLGVSVKGTLLFVNLAIWIVVALVSFLLARPFVSSFFFRQFEELQQIPLVQEITLEVVRFIPVQTWSDLFLTVVAICIGFLAVVPAVVVERIVYWILDIQSRVL